MPKQRELFGFMYASDATEKTEKSRAQPTTEPHGREAAADAG